MKHRATKVILFLLLGAIINVAVAWGCALLIDLTIDYSGLCTDQGWLYYTMQRMHKHRLLIWPSTALDGWMATRQTVPSWSVTSGAPTASAPLRTAGPVAFYLEEGTGWPCTSMYARLVMHGHSHPEPAPAITRIDSGLLIFERDRQWLRQPDSTATPASWQFVSVAPTRPLWPGFAIDTIFYAVVLWLPFAAFGRFCRRRRIKRGLCPACAYPVGESAVCTECGGAIAMPDSREPTAESFLLLKDSAGASRPLPI